jgi:hypothetical protein
VKKGRYIILDKWSWFSVISKPYQKCPETMGAMKDPETGTFFSHAGKGRVDFVRKNNMWRRIGT